MQQSRKPSPRLMGLAALCLALIAWMIIGFLLPFRAASGGRYLLPTRIGGYDAADVFDMLQFLRGHPDAAAIQHGLYAAGPALVLPAALTSLLFVLMRQLQPGDNFFGRAIPAAALYGLYALPLLYGIADYGEIICGIFLFPPAAPSDQAMAWLPAIMPVLARLKFLTLVISAILLIRVAITRRQQDAG